MLKARFTTLMCVLLPVSTLASEHTGMPEPMGTGEPLAIETVLQEIRTTNPQLRAARERVEAAKERLPQAAAWDDPMVGIDFERSDSRRLTTYNDAEVMVSQALPLTGKPARRKAIASAEIAVAEAALHQLELDLEMRAQTNFFRLANAQAQLDVNARNIALLRQLVEVTRAKYESGRQRQADVLIIETELARLEEVRIDELRGYTEAQTALNALMNRAPDIALGRAVVPEFKPVELSLETLQQHAAAHRPQLAEAESRIAVAEARVALAKRERYPDPEVRIEARQFNGDALYRFREYDTGVFITLPWVNSRKYRAAIREAQRMVDAETHERAALATETAAMVRDVWQRLQTFQHHVELFRDRLLPLARQSVDALRSNYESDRATLPEVLTTQQTVQEVEAMFYHHLTEYFIAQAELIPLVGASTFATPQSP